MQYPITDDRIDQVLELFSEDRTETEAGRLFLQDLQKILNTAYETGLNDRSRRKLYVVDDVQEKLSAADNLSDDDRAVAVKVMCLANEAYKAAWEHRGRKLGELLDFQKASVYLSMDLDAFIAYCRYARKGFDWAESGDKWLLIEAYVYGFIMGKRADRARRKTGAGA